MLFYTMKKTLYKRQKSAYPKCIRCRSRHEQVCLIRLRFQRYFSLGKVNDCRAYLMEICRTGGKQ